MEQTITQKYDGIPMDNTMIEREFMLKTGAMCSLRKNKTEINE